jgi:GH15 family glucan-1,4-alpha-glucosidase
MGRRVRWIRGGRCATRSAPTFLEHGYDPIRNTFVQAYGGTEVDASLLIIPLVGFRPVDDPRVQGTIMAIETDLLDD